MEFFVAYVIGWTVVSVVVGAVASNVGRSFFNYFLLSFFLSALIGFIVLAIKGKADKEEILDNTPHIFYCKNCMSTFSGHSDTDTKCPDCDISTEETTILTSDWRYYTQEKKAQMKESFAQGKYLRNSVADSSVKPATSSADEIKKFKELLDGGAITQEEYDAKKKQLLGL